MVVGETETDRKRDAEREKDRERDAVFCLGFFCRARRPAPFS